MENINENPVVEENTETPIIEETPEVIEIPVVEEPVVEAPVVETPVVEAPLAEEPKKEPEAISTNDFTKSTLEREVVGSVDNGAIGVATAPKPVQRKSSKKTDEVKKTMAIHSTKNVTWQGVGKVYRGYNIVTEEAAEQWLTRSHIRTATPEEVAKEFGK
jgi:hypothetical protein